MKKIELLPDLAIGSFSYSQNQLSINISLFGASVTHLQDWAKKNDYQLGMNAKILSLSKTLSFDQNDNQKNKSQIIMNVARVAGSVMDIVNQLGPGISTSVQKIEDKAHYKIISLTIYFERQPLTVVNSFCSLLKPYPIYLSSMKGEVSLGNYSGEMNVNILGD